MTAKTKYTIYIILVFLSGLYAMYEWRGYFQAANSDDLPVYSQCEKVYVKKTPFGCQPGDLIFVDADVADKYCTDEVFSRSKKGVYCVYNGKRDDRERKTPLFQSNKKQD